MRTVPQSGIAAFCALFVAGGAASAQQQITFSVDHQSSQMSVIDPCTGTPVTAADLLTPALTGQQIGPLATPCIGIPGGPGGVGIATQPACIGTSAFSPCPAELDAVSFGVDPPISQNGQNRFWFSVDENATGIAGIGTPSPSVLSEGPNGGLEAAGDVFCSVELPPGPVTFNFVGANAGALDGNGMISSTMYKYPGLGLLEPNLVGMPPHPGDNLDALDLEGPTSFGPRIFFSMDAGFADPKSGLPNTNTAAANGFVGGDVLVSTPGAAPMLYAPAPALGLDLFGPGTDDLDALILWENGIGGFQPNSQPYSWLLGQTDMLMFSVRRGSAVIGNPDSITGRPIEEGDILVPPSPLGLSPFPGIWIPAEAIGLATVRGGFANCGDDLNALDEREGPFFDCDQDGFEDSVAINQTAASDCNQNGIPDKCDIGVFGTSADANNNGIPDECDWGIPQTYCVGKVSSLGVGCVPFIDWHGSPSTTNPLPFEVNGGNILNFRNGLLFYGFNSAALPFLGGTLCVQPPLRRTPIQNSGGSGPFGNCTGSFTFDFNAWTQSGIDPFLVAGTTVYSQWWSRDPLNTFNTGLSDALRFVICP